MANKIVVKVDGFLESFAHKLDGASTVKYNAGNVVYLDSDSEFRKAQVENQNTRLFVLNARDFYGDLLTAEQSGGDTAEGFEITPGRTIQLRKSNAAIAVNADVQVSTTSGAVQTQTGTGTVIGTATEAASATDTLVKVRIS